ncbi:methyl-accepting chemotaxis protein [Archangium sp.]|uniref:methyl-accepting chemotaxis protein n=1 Tax=Archangium sp. TaxID=1872627 RepID=UPI00286A5417|nr:methyl-accepting chemotaxis protein [Archangium sp.]
MSSLSSESTKVFNAVWKTHQIINTAGSPAIVYLLVVILGLSREEAKPILMYVVPVVGVLLTFLLPYMLIRRAVSRAFEPLPETADSAQIRLERLLKIPSIITATNIICTPIGVGTIVGSAVILFGRSPMMMLWAISTVALHVMLLEILEQVLTERIFAPYAIAEFHKTQGIIPKGRGFMWPRQAWYMPYAFAVFVACTLATTLTIIGRQAYEMYHVLLSKSADMSASQYQALIQESITQLAKDSLPPIVLLGGYLVGIAAVTAWFLARRQKEGAMSVQETLVGLASGKPTLPNWISTDEIGDLSAASARVFEQLRSFSLSLRDSAMALQSSAQQLGMSTTKQTEVLSVQATALQETQVTTEEITQTSQLAAKTANNILKQAERAQDISQSGEVAIQEGMAGLEEIGVQVQEMATSIKSLDEQARQIARITSMVKDLADQSNMLALNAAIEAVRSGESGKGFGVVAKEIRSLADQSIRATHNIRSILQGIGTAIASASTLTQKGSQRVESSLKQIRNFSQQVEQLSAIVRDNANSVRQIAAAVTQQDAGIVQITQAVTDMTRIMDQTMTQLRSSEEAISVVRTVAEQVTGFVGQYGWMQEGSTTATEQQPEPVTK